MKHTRALGATISASLIAGALIAGGSAAFAGNSYTNFSTTIGTFGTAALTNTQTKATSSVPALFNPTFIGAGRTISARTYRNTDGRQGTERTGVGAGDNVTLPNEVGAGQDLRVQVAGNFTNPTSTQVSGRWASQ